MLLLLQCTAPYLLWFNGEHHGCCKQTIQKVEGQHGLHLMAQLLSGRGSWASSADISWSLQHGAEQCPNLSCRQHRWDVREEQSHQQSVLLHFAKGIPAMGKVKFF